MVKVVIIDTGAIVAALCKRDEHHAWARRAMESMENPCLTCEAVVSESFFLLEKAREGNDRLCAMLERGLIQVDYSIQEHLPETLRLIRQYRDTPMSFADACLVRMVDTHSGASIWTTDQDFRIYRRRGKHEIPVIAPWDDRAFKGE